MIRLVIAWMELTHSISFSLLWLIQLCQSSLLSKILTHRRYRYSRKNKKETHIYIVNCWAEHLGFKRHLSTKFSGSSRHLAQNQDSIYYLCQTWVQDSIFQTNWSGIGWMKFYPGCIPGQINIRVPLWLPIIRLNVLILSPSWVTKKQTEKLLEVEDGFSTA